MAPASRSHIEALASWLREHGHRVLVTREPGGTPLAERLRELLLHEAMDALTEALLVFAARRDHLVQAHRTGTRRGTTVLCDRFTDATFAYQGGGRGFDLGVLAQLEQWVQQGRQPDLTLWFDLAPALAAERRAACSRARSVRARGRGLLRARARRLRKALQPSNHVASRASMLHVRATRCGHRCWPRCRRGCEHEHAAPPMGETAARSAALAR